MPSDQAIKCMYIPKRVESMQIEVGGVPRVAYQGHNM